MLELAEVKEQDQRPTIFICFVPRPALLPLPTPLPSITETPPGILLGPSSRVKGFRQPLGPWAALRYGADRALLALGRWTVVCILPPEPPLYAHTHTHALLSPNLEVYPPLPIPACPLKPYSKPISAISGPVFFPSSATEHSLGA